MLTDWLDYLEEQVGVSVYVWGAQGQRAGQMQNPENWIRGRSKSAETGERAVRFYRALAERVPVSEIRFFDCSGLAMYFFQNLHKISGSDTTANGLWGGCAKIQKGELKPGDFVFMDSGGRKTHIGYVARDGQVIEARASGYGVEKNPLSARPWTHFGRHKWLQGEIESETVEQAARTLKQWQSLLLIYDPACLPRYGADGKYGDETDKAVCALMGALAGLREANGYAG